MCRFVRLPPNTHLLPEQHSSSNFLPHPLLRGGCGPWQHNSHAPKHLNPMEVDFCSGFVCVLKSARIRKTCSYKQKLLERRFTAGKRWHQGCKRGNVFNDLPNVAPAASYTNRSCLRSPRSTLLCRTWFLHCRRQCGNRSPASGSGAALLSCIRGTEPALPPDCLSKRDMAEWASA